MSSGTPLPRKLGVPPSLRDRRVSRYVRGDFDRGGLSLSVRTAVAGIALLLALSATTVSATELYAPPDEINWMLIGCWDLASEGADAPADMTLCFDGARELGLWYGPSNSGISGSGAYSFASDRLVMTAAAADTWPWPRPELSCDVHVRSDNDVILARCQGDDANDVANIVLQRPVELGSAGPFAVEVDDEHQILGCWGDHSTADWRPKGAPPTWWVNQYCFKEDGTWDLTSGGGDRTWGEIYSNGSGPFSVVSGKLSRTFDDETEVCDAVIEMDVLLSLTCSDGGVRRYLREGRAIDDPGQ